MKSYSFRIDLQCPQCGAPVVLGEAENIVRCAFCRTASIITTQPYPCFYIRPRHEPASAQYLFYVPYWRFKGLEFTMDAASVSYRVVDTSFIAREKMQLPASLGFRSQTQKLGFVENTVSGQFLSPSITRKQLFGRIGKKPAGIGKDNEKNRQVCLHVGEIVSLIFTPFYKGKNGVVDGLSGQKISASAAVVYPENTRPGYHPGFMPGLCPHCGWNLSGAQGTTALYCENCTAFWRISGKGLRRLRAEFFGPDQGAAIWIGFWKLEVAFKRMGTLTCADMIKLSNLARVIRDTDRHRPLSFFIPAFKVNPRLFLRLARQNTLLQPAPGPLNRIPGQEIYPADLPVQEALQSVPPLLLDLACDREAVFTALKKEKIALKSFSLVYFAFRESGSEFVQDTLGYSIQKNALKFGRKL